MIYGGKIRGSSILEDLRGGGLLEPDRARSVDECSRLLTGMRVGWKGLSR